jgi:hypothetical protein
MNSDPLYSFLMRALLTEQSLDEFREFDKARGSVSVQNLERDLGLSSLDSDEVARSQKMATVYTAISAFENSARDLVKQVLVEKGGEDWWNSCVSARVRAKAESRQAEEAKFRWHTHRGSEHLDYTDFGELGNIIENNWDVFEPHFHSLTWVKNLFDILERSRNVIMHSGQLEETDVVRIGVHLRDWKEQVG